MIEQSIICQVLESSDLSILSENELTSDMFLTHKREIEFIINHFEEYKQLPDKVTFLANFKDFQMLDVSESSDYLAYKLKEGYTYTKIVPVFKEASEIIRNDSIKGIDYLLEAINELNKEIPVTKNKGGIDIVKQSDTRLQQYKERCKVKGMLGIPTGIPQLDDLTHGWLWGEELVIITGRTNVGKSWIAEYFGTMAWQMEYKVLFYSGEMSAEMIGFRFDTLNKHFSNMGLLHGNGTLGKNPQSEGMTYLDKDYEEYISELSKKSGFIVVTPDDFNGKKPTTDDIKKLAVKTGADLIIIDQLSLMRDKRKADITRLAYNNIAEDLFLMSKELKKPVIALAQANREAVKNKKKGVSPELHDLAESDGVGQNATRVISLSVVESTLKLSLKKNRYGLNNKDVMMIWDINTGYLTPLIKNPEGLTEDDGDEDYGF